MNRIFCICLVALLPQSVTAQGQVGHFHASSAGSQFLSIDDLSNAGRGTARLRLQTTHENRPLVFMDDDALTEIIADRTYLDANIVFGIFDNFDVGLRVPVLMAQSGWTPDGESPLETSSLGDIMMGAKYVVERSSGSAPGLGFMMGLSAPTGNRDAFMSEDSLSAQFKVIGNMDIGGGVETTFGFGYLSRSGFTIAELDVGDEFLVEGGLIWSVAEKAALVGEFAMATAVSEPFGQVGSTPGAVNVAGRYDFTPRSGILVGAGLGLFPGYGTPAWRAFVGLEFGTALGSIFDAKPKRKPRAEIASDMGGVERCWDGSVWSPDEGCPSTSMDVSDDADAMMLPVSQSAKPPSISSPSRDYDRDGILNSADQCPFIREDQDKFRDQDGCPDPDNDYDFIVDTQDSAPQSPEDWDAFRDNDGRPDADNDGDGLADALDACPDRPGFGNGCPGQGMDWLRVAQNREQDTKRVVPMVVGQFIYPGQPIEFDAYQPIVSGVNGEVINALAHHIRRNPNLTRLEVGVYVDTQNGAENAKIVSNKMASALTDLLVSRGVSRSRLYPRGLGLGTALSDLGEKSGQRVELRLLSETEPSPVLGQTELPAKKVQRPDKTARRNDESGRKPIEVIRPGGEIRFVARKAAVTESTVPTVQQFAARLLATPDWTKVQVAVHTDGLGDKSEKLALSQKRAEAVMMLLIESGIDGERLSARGYGASRPIASDETSDGRAKNRRVEFMVMEKATNETEENGAL